MFPGDRERVRRGDEMSLLAAAAAQCLQDCSCAAFNTDGWLKRSTEPLVPNSDVCFYIRNSTGAAASCPPGKPATATA